MPTSGDRVMGVGMGMGAFHALGPSGLSLVRSTLSLRLSVQLRQTYIRLWVSATALHSMYSVFSRIHRRWGWAGETGPACRARGKERYPR